jgi:hypothetical protein
MADRGTTVYGIKFCLRRQSRAGGGRTFRTAARGGDFDPSAITRQLGRRPNQAWRKGERKSFLRHDGTVRYFDSHYEWSGWKKWLNAGQSKRPLEWQLWYWTKLLKPKASVLRALRRRGVVVELNCCVFESKTTALRLPSTLLATLGSLGVDLDVTWYAP